MEGDRCGSRIVHQEKVDLAISRDFAEDEVGRMSQLFKAFSDQGRLRILHALLQQEMCVCDLAALLKASESSVSHQLRLLRNIGLVANRREGTVLYYRPVNQELAELITLARDLSSPSE
ncbi:MAG: ArsR/SmtB family transcription factor [Desulforhopalus sp.]